MTGPLTSNIVVHPRGRSGLTLVEVLVTLAIVVVLTALVLTGLRAARTSSRDTKQLADLRSGAALFASWSHDNKEEFLNLQRDPQRYAMRCEPSTGGHSCVHWESQWNRWGTVYFWTTGERAQVQGFFYSFTFVSDPTLWTLDPGPQRLGHEARRHFRSVRTHEVRFPSEKALLMSFGTSGDHPIALVDGSAMVASSERVLPQTTATIWMPAHDDPVPGVATIEGVHGRDVSR